MATGRFHTYWLERCLKVFEYSPSNSLSGPSNDKPNILLWIGGLFDTFAGVPYVAEIAHSLTQESSSTWSVVEIQLTSSGIGFTTGDLHRDAEEIARCISWLRARTSIQDSKIVLMGHSTGSQDVLHYLYYATDSERPNVDGAILQAPVSDRDALQLLFNSVESTSGRDELRMTYDECVHQARLLKSQPESPSLPRSLTSKLGYGQIFISASRFLSLVSPDSPEKPALDDLFSSDLSDNYLRKTFGSIGSRGRLINSFMAERSTRVSSRKYASCLLVLMSGADEYVPKSIDKAALLARWNSALEDGGVALSPSSGVVEGALHDGSGVDGKKTDLLDRCLQYLESVTKNTQQGTQLASSTPAQTTSLIDP